MKPKPSDDDSVRTMTNSELVAQLEALLPDEQSNFAITSELLEMIIEGLNEDITLSTETGEELTRISGEEARLVTHSSLETFITDLIVNSAFEEPVKRLEVLAELGHGRLSQQDARHILKLIADADAVGTIVMGGENYVIVKREGG